MNLRRSIQRGEGPEDARTLGEVTRKKTIKGDVGVWKWSLGNIEASKRGNGGQKWYRKKKKMGGRGLAREKKKKKKRKERTLTGTD